MFQRPQLNVLNQRLKESRRFIQILSGPRQVGKTTLAKRATESFSGQSHYASADQPSAPDVNWIIQQWEIGRRLRATGPALLVLDEIHKIARWSEVVKMLWDEDSFDNKTAHDLHVVLLGSSQFLMHAGTTESLTGRFELIKVPHWSFAEMQAAFGWTVEQHIIFGGYPGAANLINDEVRWRNYMLNTVLEPTLSRDVLQITRIDKPALLRRLFALGCRYSSQILSYQKMVGQLQDSGNTTTLSHYLTLLEGAWMMTGLDKYAGDYARSRASSPKLLALDTSFISSQSEQALRGAQIDPDWWGRLVESSIGAHLYNYKASGVQLQYWRDRNHEIDFVLSHGSRLVAIEVKSGRHTGSLSGLNKFVAMYPNAKPMVVGTGGIPIKDFLLTPPAHWLSQ